MSSLEEHARRRLELPAWILQLCIVGYELAGSVIRRSSIDGIVILVAIAVPACAVVIRNWSVSPNLGSTKRGDLLRFIAMSAQFSLAYFALRWKAPELIQADSPLVGLGVPYLWVVILRGRRLQLFIYLVASLVLGISIAEAWPAGADDTSRTVPLLFRTLQLTFGALVIGLMAKRHLRRAAETEREVAKGLLSRTTTTFRHRRQYLDRRLRRVASGTPPPGPMWATQPPIELGMEIRRLRRRRGRLGTTVHYEEPATLSTTILLEADAARPLITFMRTVVEHEPDPVRVTVAVDRSGLQATIVFDGSFALLVQVPKGFRCERVDRGQSLRYDLNAEIHGEEGIGSVINQLPEVGIYGTILAVGTAVQVLDVPLTLLQHVLHGRRLTPALLATAGALLVIAVLRGAAQSKRRRAMSVASARAWAFLTAAPIIGYAGLVGPHDFFLGRGAPQPFGWQIVACAAVWAATIPTWRALVHPTIWATLVVGTTVVVNQGLNGLTDVNVVRVAAWWPTWTLAAALGLIVTRRALREMEELTMRTADAAATRVATSEVEAGQAGIDTCARDGRSDPPQVEALLAAHHPDTNVRLIDVPTFAPLNDDEADVILATLAALGSHRVVDLTIVATAGRLVIEVSHVRGAEIAVPEDFVDLLAAMHGWVAYGTGRVRIFLPRWATAVPAALVGR